MGRIIIMVFIFLFFITPIIASAEINVDEHIIDNANKMFVSNINDIPPPENNILTPDMNWSSQGYISGWIDIIGFRNVAIENGIAYIIGDAEKIAIVKYDAKNMDVSNMQGVSRVPRMDDRLFCTWCAADSLEKTVTIVNGIDTVTTYMNVTFKWHETIKNSGGHQRINYVDYASFSDTENKPHKHNSLPDNYVATITIYNNTISPKTVIWIDTPLNVSKKIIYKNETAEYKPRIGIIENNNKNVTYANLTNVSMWNITGRNISRLENSIVINSAKIDFNQLNISVFNFFETKYVTKYNVTTIDLDKLKIWNPLVFYYVSFILIFVWLAFYVVRRVFK